MELVDHPSIKGKKAVVVKLGDTYQQLVAFVAGKLRIRLGLRGALGDKVFYFRFPHHPTTAGMQTFYPCKAMHATEAWFGMLMGRTMDMEKASKTTRAYATKPTAVPKI